MIFVAYELNLPLNKEKPHYRSQCPGEWGLIWAHDSRPIYRALTYIAVPLLGPHQPRYIGLTLYWEGHPHRGCWWPSTNRQPEHLQNTTGPAQRGWRWGFNSRLLHKLKGLCVEVSQHWSLAGYFHKFVSQLTHCGLVTVKSYIWVNIGSGNSLLHDDTIYDLCKCLATFIWGQF